MPLHCGKQLKLYPRHLCSMSITKYSLHLRLLHTMNVRFSLLDIAQRILGVTLPNFQ